MKAPSLYPLWVPPYEEQIQNYAEEHGLLYLHFLKRMEATGFDMSRDT